MSNVLIQTLQESDNKHWSYGLNYTDGALRLFRVDSLLSTSPKNATITLSEWRDLDQRQKNSAIPKYAAISHSWALSPEAQRLSSIANRPLNIDLGQNAVHTISWHGLCQAARAALHLKCDYLWLDLLCLHQASAADKKLQIQNMGHIYQNAKAVIVMAGGVSAAQGVERMADWITRAWTFQEATLCANTHVLFLYPPRDSRYHYTMRCALPPGTHEIVNIDGDLALSELRTLLLGRRGVYIDITDRSTGEVISSQEFLPGCFGDSDALISSLQGVFGASTPEMKQSAAWRSIWLRTSSKSQDMVFSMMHVLGVHIEVDYTRTLEDLVLELARKSASLPSWLDIGPDLPFEPRHGLVPMIPLFKPNHARGYKIDNQLIPASQYVLTYEYISEFDIRILTPTTTRYDGDLVCAVFLEVQREPSGRVLISHGPGQGQEVEPGPSGTPSHVMVIGKPAMHFNIPLQFLGPMAWKLQKSESGVWERLRGATYIPSDWLEGANRSHLKIGGPPGAEIMPCDCSTE